MFIRHVFILNFKSQPCSAATHTPHGAAQEPQGATRDRTGAVRKPKSSNSPLRCLLRPDNQHRKQMSSGILKGSLS